MTFRLLRPLALLMCAFVWAGPAIAQDGGMEVDLDSLLAVDVAPEEASTRTEILEARGIIESTWQADLASEIAGRIVSLPFDEGDRFSEGDELVGLDCAFYRAAYNESLATLQAARKTLEVNKQLAEFNAVSILEVSLAESEVIRAGAAVQSRQLVVDRCSLLAPSDGWVVERHVSLYESVAEGEELLAVVGDDRLRIRLIVPSAWLVWLEAESEFLFQVDETGADFLAVLDKTGARVDPASQTLTVFGRLQGDVSGMMPGMSGTATFGTVQQGE